MWKISVSVLVSLPPRDRKGQRLNMRAHTQREDDRAGVNRTGWYGADCGGETRWSLGRLGECGAIPKEGEVSTLHSRVTHNLRNQPVLVKIWSWPEHLVTFIAGQAKIIDNKVRRGDHYLNRDMVCEPVISQEQCHITVRKKETEKAGEGGARWGVTSSYMERQLSHHRDTLCCIAALTHR